MSSTHVAPVPESPSLRDEDYRAQADFRYRVRRFLRYSEQQARAAGITPQQHLLLLIVRGHPSYPGVSITEIAEQLQVRHHSASLLVERVVRRGLLLRSGDPTDRRKALVSLSPQGLEVLERITHANRQALGDLQDALVRLQRSLAPEPLTS